MALILTVAAVAAATTARPATGRPITRQKPPVTYTNRLPEPRGLTPMSWRGLARLSVAGDGSVLSCTSEVTPGAEERFGTNNCSAPPPEVLLKLRGGLGKAPVTVLLEVNMTIAGAGPIPVVTMTPGHKITSLIKGNFEISTLGRVENCKTVERQGDAMGPADICERAGNDRYAPFMPTPGSPIRAQATIMVATSVEDIAAK